MIRGFSLSIFFKLIILIFLSGCGLQQKVSRGINEVKTDGRMLHDKVVLRKVNKQIKKGDLGNAEDLLPNFSLDSFRYVAAIRIFNEKYKQDPAISLEEIEDTKQEIRNIVDPYQSDLATILRTPRR